MKKSKCCSAIAHKQEAGNYFCSHCISICETARYSLLPVTMLILFLVGGLCVSCYAPPSKLMYSKKEKVKTLDDYYKTNPLIVEIIESNGNSKAVSFKDAKGIMQITNICLKDFNNLNKTKYTEEDLFIPEINMEIANWCLSKRIPELLKERKLKVNVTNILICYNGGIQEALRYNKSGQLNEETKNYLIKYFHSI